MSLYLVDVLTDFTSKYALRLFVCVFVLSLLTKYNISLCGLLVCIRQVTDRSVFFGGGTGIVLNPCYWRFQCSKRIFSNIILLSLNENYNIVDSFKMGDCVAFTRDVIKHPTKIVAG